MQPQNHNRMKNQLPNIALEGTHSSGVMSRLFTLGRWKPLGFLFLKEGLG
jgi:hypothetical protein